MSHLGNHFYSVDQFALFEIGRSQEVIVILTVWIAHTASRCCQITWPQPQLSILRICSCALLGWTPLAWRWLASALLEPAGRKKNSVRFEELWKGYWKISCHHTESGEWTFRGKSSNDSVCMKPSFHMQILNSTFWIYILIWGTSQRRAECWRDYLGNSFNTPHDWQNWLSTAMVLQESSSPARSRSCYRGIFVW